jgi:hypothetical protein
VATELAAADVKAARSGSEDNVLEYPAAVAIVNGEIITDSDLDVYCRLSIFLMGGENDVPDSMKKELRQRELEKKIDDVIKWQFINRMLKNNPPANRILMEKAVNEEITRMLKRYKMNLEQFKQMLASRNIDMAALTQKIRIDIAWQSCMMGKITNIANSIQISDKNAETILANYKKDTHQESYHLHRMFFPFIAGASKAEVHADVDKVKQMLLSGADFDDISGGFGKKYNTEHWKLRPVHANQLSREEINVVKNMEMGTTALVENSNGYILLFLRYKQIAAAEDAAISFFNVVLPFDQGLDQTSQNHLMNQVRDMIRESKDCHEFAKKAQESSIMLVTKPSSMLLSHFMPNYRSLLQTIPVGGISQPINEGKGAILVFCVLAKNPVGIRPTNLEEINSAAGEMKLNLLANVELRNLREMADIKYVGKYEQLKNSAKNPTESK